MAGISSTTLFHFTRSFETLIKILETGMWPRYCVERDWGDKDLVIPMICACDIPLSDMSIHQMKYGKYGIGLDKSWSKRQGFTPVLYVSDKSDIYNRLNSYAKEKLTQPILCNRDVIDEEYLLYYAKRTVGTDADREFLRMKKKPKFINEREWRFIPKDVAPLYFASKGKGQEIDCNRLSRITQNYKLKLEPKNIEYIFIDNEGERLQLIKNIERIYNKYSADDLKVLTSKIISNEQMTKDF